MDSVDRVCVIVDVGLIVIWLIGFVGFCFIDFWVFRRYWFWVIGFDGGL